MPQRINSLHQILLTQKLVTENPLHLSLKIMDEHVSGLGRAALLAPCQDSGGENGRHPARRHRRIATGPINEDHVPRDLVYVVRQIVDTQFAIREEEVLNGAALVSGPRLRRREELLRVLDPRGVLHVVGLDPRMGLLELGDQELALVEHGAAVVVQGLPEERLVGEAEDEEAAAGGGAVAERGCYGVDLGGGHGCAGGGVGEGGVVEEGVGDGARERRGGVEAGGGR
ncbi:LOW QUALITY PROTEIN: hypothetical protein TorRG33x02_161270 [Trema orientale]|uniref:Uncharacterized protein n=1 Tax=Trema orientale TaxID=63057 RepID=A0A2P5ERD6_TREOI|nr:LOW QUALITY PROTEIN: hypothetical protein TorRG33x02_161270 [Trema orientale]